MERWVAHQLLATSGQNIIALLSFLTLPRHWHFLVFPSGRSEGESDISPRALWKHSLGIISSCWNHLSARRCRLLHPRIPGTPACSVEAAGTARFPRVKATNQIDISFTGLTQSGTPKRKPSLKEHFLCWQNPWGEYFVTELNHTFVSGRKLAKLYTRQCWPNIKLCLVFVVN